MKTIKARPEDADRLLLVLSRAYNMKAEDFSIQAEPNGIVQALLDDTGRKYDSVVFIKLENNDVVAYLSIYPPIGEGKYLTEEEIFDAVAQEGITVNLDREAIREAVRLHKDDFLVERLKIASGIKAQPGKDAVITLHFNAPDRKPTITPDGKVDYKNIDNIIHARKGDVLITKKPATQGVNGMSVKNTEIPAPAGAEADLVLGGGVQLNPLGTHYIATRDGYVEFSNNLLAVHEVYIIENDVDFSTGNIKFNGTVHVKGDVLAGFKVEATKDVFVDGICGDCEIIAQKSIYIKTGIKGNGTNLFKASENVVMGYCEKGRVFAKGDIIIKKYSYNSELYAGNSVDARAEEGIIAGGTVRAFSEILANQLGTQGNSRFNIYMGTKYYIDQALEKIRREKAKMTEVFGQIQDLLGKFNLSRPEVANNKKIKKLQHLKRNFEELIAEMNDKEDELTSKAKAQKPKIKVKGMVFEGVTVMFFNSASTVRERTENAIFYFDEKYAEVAWVSLKDAKNFEFE